MVRLHGVTIPEVTTFPSNPREGTLVYRSDELFIYSVNAETSGWKQITNTTTIPANIINQDSTHRFVTDIERSTWNTTLYGNPLIVQEEYPPGTNGGTFTSGAWRTRPINTVKKSQVWGSLALNRITLLSGLYDFLAFVPGHRCGCYKSRLISISGDSIDMPGTSERASADDQTFSIICTVLNLTQTTVFEIHHRCVTTRSNTGFGYAMNVSGFNEVYLTVKIVKIS